MKIMLGYSSERSRRELKLLRFSRISSAMDYAGLPGVSQEP